MDVQQASLILEELGLEDGVLFSPLSGEEPINDVILPSGPTLFENQIKCFNRIEEILNKLYFWNDDSRTGSGKTVLTIKVGIQRQLQFAVFGPLASLENWNRELNKYGGIIAKDVEGDDIIYSYRKLSASHDTKQPKHGLLTKIIENGKIKEYQPTEYLDQLINEGTCFIFDETQNIVGNSYQAMAARCIVNRILYFYYITGTRSKAGFLSATMVDKFEHLFSFLRCIGAIQDTQLYRTEKGNIIATGFKELYNYGRMIDDRATIQYWKTNPPAYDPDSDEKLREQIWDYYTKVLKHHFTATMEINTTLNEKATQEVKNMYVKFPDVKQKIEYLKSIGNLAQAVKFNNKVEFVNFVPNSKTFGNIMKSLSSIQYAKRNLVLSLAKNILNSKYYRISDGVQVWPKIVLYSSFIAVLEYWNDELFEFDPLLISGQTKQSQRTEIIDLFNRTDNKYRVLICTMQTGGVSINLNDKNGDYPRIGLCLTDYNTRNQKQTAGRFYREGTVGPSTVAFIFGDTQLKTDSPLYNENSIIKAIYRKGKLLKEFHSEQEDIFPCDYPDEYVEYDHIIVPQGLRIEETWN